MAAILFVDSATAAGNTVTVPTVQVGDFMICSTQRANNTPISLITGWTNWPGTPTSNTTGGSMRVAYRIATSTSETCGSWVSSTRTNLLIYRNVTAPGAIAWTAPTVVNPISFPALTLTTLDGSSWGVRFGASTGTESAFTTGNPTTAPATPRQTASGSAGAAGWAGDSNGGMTSNPTAGTVTTSASGVNLAVTLELLGTLPSGGGQFFAMF